MKTVDHIIIGLLADWFGTPERAYTWLRSHYGVGRVSQMNGLDQIELRSWIQLKIERRAMKRALVGSESGKQNRGATLS